MARITQVNKKNLLAFMSAVFAVLTDEELAELSGLTLRPFMERKAKYKAKIREILEESK